jgi:hypothetical protein
LLIGTAPDLFGLVRGARAPTGRGSSKRLSQGLDATPIWIPQLSMSVGAVLLAVCFWDHLIRCFRPGDGIRSDLVEQSHAE